MLFTPCNFFPILFQGISNSLKKNWEKIQKKGFRQLEIALCCVEYASIFDTTRNGKRVPRVFRSKQFETA